MRTRNLTVVLAFQWLVGCGAEDSPGHPPGSGGSAGAGGAGNELCAKACSVTTSCDSQADVVACEAQCKKEIAGLGYLNGPVALDYFQQFAALDNDKDCLYSKGGFAWWWWTKNPDRIDALAEQDVLQQCKDVWLACIGPTATQDGFRELCFLSHYRYSAKIRTKVEACYSLTCSPSEPDACVASEQVKGEPWLAGVEQAKLQ